MAQDGLYFCPTAREVRSATVLGGIAVCCTAPEFHVEMPDTRATAAVSLALSEMRELPVLVVDEMTDAYLHGRQVAAAALYNTVLRRAVQAEAERDGRRQERASAAEEQLRVASERVESLSQSLEETITAWQEQVAPLQHEAARVQWAVWNVDRSAEEAREVVRAVVGHPFQSAEDGAALLVALRAELKRLGLPVSDTAEEQVERVRELATHLTAWAGEKQTQYATMMRGCMVRVMHVLQGPDQMRHAGDAQADALSAARALQRLMETHAEELAALVAEEATSSSVE